METVDSHPSPQALPDWVVCPKCHKAELQARKQSYYCTGCHTDYPMEAGFPALLSDPEDRFEDESNDARNQEEENANSYSSKAYYLPLFEQLLGRPEQQKHKARILSCGCGVGIDVDIYREQGYNAYGVDCGQRASSWLDRKNRHDFYIGNVKSLPFADNSFDLITTGCLLPHVGVVGDSTTTTSDYELQRLHAVKEMVRVTKPDGYIITANPNRSCPLDLFHEGQMKSDHSLARFHSHREPFLLSLEDFRELFVQQAGCSALETLPIANYWSFQRKSSGGATRFLVPLVKAYFRFLSMQPFAWLRGSGFNPWLMIKVVK